MPIEVTIREDVKTLIVRGHGNVTKDDIQAMPEQVRQLLEDHEITRFLIDTLELMSLLGGSTATIFSMGSSYPATGNPLNIPTAIVMPKEMKARKDLKFMETVEANRGRVSVRFLNDLDSAWAWLLDQGG